MDLAQTRVRAPRGKDRQKEPEVSRMVLGKPARAGDSPVSENWVDKAGSRVHRDTRNLDGTSGDHPVTLNTT